MNFQTLKNNNITKLSKKKQTKNFLSKAKSNAQKLTVENKDKIKTFLLLFILNNKNQKMKKIYKKITLFSVKSNFFAKIH